MPKECNCGDECSKNAEDCEFYLATLLARKKSIEDQEPISFDFLDVVKDREDPWLDRKYE